MQNQMHPNRVYKKPAAMALALTFSVQLIALRALFKYLPHPALACAVVFIGAFLIYFLLVKYFLRDNPLLSSPWLSLFLICLVFLVNFLTYPKADSLKLKGQGSDADDAIILATTRLFHGQYPYSQMTYLNHPISPGPGILFFLSPFVLTHVYWLAIPFYVFLFILSCYKISDSLQFSNAILLFLLSSLGFWEYMIIGSDLIVISILIALMTWLILKYDKNPKVLFVLSIVMGILMTSRVTLLYYIPVLALILFKRNRNAGILFGSLALFSCLALHAAFYFYEPDHYAPMHLLHKGRASTNVYIVVLNLLCTGWVLVSLIKEKMLDNLKALKYAWLLLALPHLFIGIGMVISDHFKLANSEGPGYLIIQLFPFLLFCLFSLKPGVERTEGRIR